MPARYRWLQRLHDGSDEATVLRPEPGRQSSEVEVTMDEILKTEDVRLLADIGILALSAGLDRAAEAIFNGVAAARPAQEAGPLGLAMVQMSRSDLDAAVDILRALAPSDAVLTYLGLALMRRGDIAEASDVFGSVVATATGTPFAEVAAARLKEIAGGGPPRR